MEYSWDINELLMDLFGLAMSQPSFFKERSSSSSSSSSSSYLVTFMLDSQRFPDPQVLLLKKKPLRVKKQGLLDNSKVSTYHLKFIYTDLQFTRFEA